MASHRRLNWEGCLNVRDLGGLATRDGRRTRAGAVVRADTPNRLTPAGWEALLAHGIGTIVSLVSDGASQTHADRAGWPERVVQVPVAVEDLTDTAFVERWVETNAWCTPSYYPDALERWPERLGRAVRAVAEAEPGGVLVHCSRGRDRTGLVSLVVLALAGVDAEAIADDWAMSLEAAPDEERRTIHAVETREGLTAREMVLRTLASFDSSAWTKRAGLGPEVARALRARLFDSS